MKDNVKLGTCLLIFLGFALFRTYVSEFHSSITIFIMALVNCIAFISVVGIIIINAYNEMNDMHNKIAIENKIDPPDNKDIKRFCRRACITFIIVIILLYIYISRFRCEIYNDIMSIGTLIISIESNIFVKRIKKKSYKSFY